MALQKRFNDPWNQFVDPYWTIISGVLSHGRGRSKLTLHPARMRRIGSVTEPLYDSEPSSIHVEGLYEITLCILGGAWRSHCFPCNSFASESDFYVSKDKVLTFFRKVIEAPNEID